MNKDIIKEAYETINEWGINEDGFITQNFQHSMYGGEASDNSIDLSCFYRTQLRTIVDLGIAEAKRLLEVKPKISPTLLFGVVWFGVGFSCASLWAVIIFIAFF